LRWTGVCSSQILARHLLRSTRGIRSGSSSRYVSLVIYKVPGTSNVSQWYEISTDAYHGVKRLDLYNFDGSPMNPMFLAYSPTPQMLPTQTLNPTSAPSASPASSTKRKRNLPAVVQQPSRSRWLDPDRWWWLGLGTTALGAVGYFAF
jgi:hypothetical protein